MFLLLGDGKVIFISVSKLIDLLRSPLLRKVSHSSLSASRHGWVLCYMHKTTSSTTFSKVVSEVNILSRCSVREKSVVKNLNYFF